MENNDISTGGYCLSTISTNPWLRLEVIIFPVVGWRKLELGRFLLQTSKPSQVSLGPWNTFALFKPQIYYWWFVLLKPAPPPSKSASSGLLCDTKTCTLRKVLQCSSKYQWMLTSFDYLSFCCFHTCTPSSHQRKRWERFALHENVCSTETSEQIEVPCKV